MARKLRYGKGHASIEITGPQKELFEKALREVAPEVMKVIETEIDARVKEAKKDWLVRYGKPVKTKRGTRIVKQTSERSIDKFETGIRILSGGTKIEGYFKNTAPYAAAIVAADYSQKNNGQKTNLKKGQNLATETMWKPAQKNLDKLLKKLGKAYVDQQKKVQ